MLDITKIHQPPFFFQPRKNIPVVFHGLQEKRRVRIGPADFLVQSFKAVVIIVLLQGRNCLFKGSSCGFQPFFKLRKLLFRMKIVRFKIFFQQRRHLNAFEFFPDRLKIPAFSHFKEFCRKVSIRRRNFRHALMIRARDFLPEGVEGGSPPFQAFFGVLPDKGAYLSRRKSFEVRIKLLYRRLKPFKGFRQALYNLKGLPDGLSESLLAAVAAVFVQKREKFRLFLLKIQLQKLVQSLFLQKLLLDVIAYLKVRLYIYQIKKSANHLEGKGMKGAYIRQRHSLKLLFEEFYLPGIFLGFLFDCLFDFFFHLRRRRVGKGHDEHSVNAAFPFKNQLLDPLHQHRRLSGACRRRHQYIFISQLNGSRLLRRPFHRVSSFPLLPFCSFYPYILTYFLSLGAVFSRAILVKWKH